MPVEIIGNVDRIGETTTMLVMIDHETVCASILPEHSIRDPPLPIDKFFKEVYGYRVSVKSLFIFEIFEETLKSIVRSPISTTKPPLISGFTLGTTLSFLP